MSRSATKTTSKPAALISHPIRATVANRNQMGWQQSTKFAHWRRGDSEQVRGIYSPDSLQLPDAVEEAYSAADAGEKSRVHPSVPMKLAISDRSSTLLPLALDQMVDSALVVRGSALLDTLINILLAVGPGAASGSGLGGWRIGRH